MRRRRQHDQRGSVLLLVLFLMAFTTPVVLMMLDGHTTHTRCIHNHVQGMSALYIAQAGVHDAINELLQQDNTWRAGFTNRVFPAGSGHKYTVSVADGDPGEIVITSTGQTAEGFTKTVTAAVTGF